MEVTSEFSFIVGLAITIGWCAGYLIWRIRRQAIIRRAQIEAQDMLQEAKDLKEMQELEERARVQEIESLLWTKHEAELLKMENRVEDLQTDVEEKQRKTEQSYQDKRKFLQQSEQEIRNEESRIQNWQQKFDSKKDEISKLNKKLVDALCQKMQSTAQNIIDQLKATLETEAEQRATKYIDSILEEYKERAEHYARNAMDAALNRFARAYCPERGIGAVTFPDLQTRQRFCDPTGANIRAIQESCGCDIVVEDDMEMIGVAGFDPVRRELTRRTLEKVLKEHRSINPEFIKRTADQQKKDLYKQIRQDGDALARELKLENLHPEIKQMMGSLRYRYSFTQNQYFHCAEVGWLCGLLASEVKAEVKVARRSGMLHDIGKSMDHATEGGHAVIGANFISERGESAEIVHNVRAHHFDEQPNSDVAFLVIAADAISGARPGARRSTMESYTQKVNELQEIARSFEGVNDCFILNGGRECRVLVDSRRIDDRKALEMSRQMAQRIENECNYPGQIRVVIVRETLVNETTFARH